MAGTSEPSYYEVALTSKQVMAALVIVLACLTAAFFAGFWIGRDSERPLVLASQELHQPSPIERPTEEPLPVTPGTEGEPRLEPVTEPVAESFGAEPTAEPEAASAPASTGGFEAPPTLPPPNGVVNPDPNVPLWKQRLDRAREAARLEKEFAQATGEASAAGASPSPAPAAAEPQPQAADSQPASAQPAPIVAETTRPAEPAPTAAAPRTSVSEPAPARPASAGAESVYVVQVLVTKDPAKARQVIAQLKGAGYPASLATFEQGGATLSRVKVGPYRERARAQAIGNEIKTKLKLDAWVRAEAP